MQSLPGRILTFYSYKGGTGRSMALANVAWLLAANGARVLTIDWDLEAPGLHRYFRPFLTDPELLETQGLIDTMWNFGASQLASAPHGVPLREPNATLITEGLEDATRRLNWKRLPESNEFPDGNRFPGNGCIDFIGAGRQGVTYSERANTFDWRRFYELGGERVLSAVRADLRARYHWVLIDSRTGVSDTAGICTMQMPDAVVACFTLNRQSIDGVAAILASIREYRSGTRRGADITLFPVAMRIENYEKDRLDAARLYARKTLAPFLPEVPLSERAYWDRMEVTYRPWYAYEEVLAAFGDVTGASGTADSLLAQMETLAEMITDPQNRRPEEEKLRTPEILNEDRDRVLALYAFSPATRSAVDAPRSDPTSTETADPEFLRHVLAKEQKWRHQGFDYRLLLSRRELSMLTPGERGSFGRHVAFYLDNSERVHSFLRSFDWIWAGSILLGFISTGVGYLVLLNTSDNKYQFINLLITIFCVVWVISVLVCGILAQRSQNAPYGVTLGQALRLALVGPFDLGIRDYIPPRN
jgi:cellulose biosynthesis protein BcsQ